MWYDYILGLACISAIVRLALLLANNKSFDSKIGKVASWFIGLALFTISWIVIRSIFPSVDMGNKLQGDSHYRQEETMSNKKPGSEDEQISIKIK